MDQKLGDQPELANYVKERMHMKSTQDRKPHVCFQFEFKET